MPKFKFAISSLPDFLFDHSMIGDSNRERIAEHLERWFAAIRGLWVADVDGGYSLCFSKRKRDQRIAISLSTAADKKHELEILEDNLSSLSQKFRLPLETKTEHESCVFLPDAKILELRQFESTRAGLHKNYIFGGWWKPSGTLANFVQALSAASSDARIEMVLAPTIVNETETSQLLAESMRQRKAASSTEQHSFGKKVVSKSKSRVDIIADANAKSLEFKTQRLDDPFLIQCFVISTAHTTAWQVAKSLQAAWTGDLERSSKDELPNRSQVFEIPKESFSKVTRVLDTNTPDLTIARTSSRPKELERIAHLVDAQSAAVAFRLPLAVNSGLPGVEVQQLVPQFSPGPDVLAESTETSDCPTVSIGYSSAENRNLRLPTSQLCRHLLITGFTGSGKTETTLGLLSQLWNEHRIPFLVIEPAKAEYRGLLTVKNWRQQDGVNISVFTVGNESESPLRINPLRPIDGTRLEKHFGRIQSCLEAAMPQFGPLPSILQQALIDAYAEHGWHDLTEVVVSSDARTFPLFFDVERHALKAIASRQYGSEVTDNISGAIRSRLFTLQSGSLGRCLETIHSIGPDQLFGGPVVVELNDLRGQDKILVTLFLLLMLREHCEQRGYSQELRHVTVIEEAHNVFGRAEDKSGQDMSNAKFEVVQELSNMLAELRAFGEGIVIADQSPSKLAPDAMRNTGTHIAHQLRSSDDRTAIANAMVMSDEQANFLAKLRPGEAALFTSELQRATFVKMNRFKRFTGEGFDSETAVSRGYRPTFSKSISDLDAETANARLDFELKSGDLTHERAYKHLEHLGLKQLKDDFDKLFNISIEDTNTDLSADSLAESAYFLVESLVNKHLDLDAIADANELEAAKRSFVYYFRILWRLHCVSDDMVPSFDTVAAFFDVHVEQALGDKS